MLISRCVANMTSIIQYHHLLLASLMAIKKQMHVSGNLFFFIDNYSANISWYLVRRWRIPTFVIVFFSQYFNTRHKYIIISKKLIHYKSTEHISEAIIPIRVWNWIKMKQFICYSHKWDIHTCIIEKKFSCMVWNKSKDRLATMISNLKYGIF